MERTREKNACLLFLLLGRVCKTLVVRIKKTSLQQVIMKAGVWPYFKGERAPEFWC